MDDCSDSALPPSSAGIHREASTSRKRERPIATSECLQKERDRREMMTERFRHLQSIVPNLRPKPTKEAVVAETIRYIRFLEGEIERLEEVMKYSSHESRAAISRCINLKTNVSVDVSAGAAFFGIETPVRRRSAVEILEVFEKHHAEVLSASVAVDDDVMTVAVTALLKNHSDTNDAEKIKTDILSL